MNCKFCKADCVHSGEDRVKECFGHIPMTNADRGPTSKKCDDRSEAIDAWIEWLQQPAKEDA